MGNSSHSPCSVHGSAMAASTAHIRLHKILEELPVALDSYNSANSDIKRLQTASKLLEHLKDLLFEALQAGSASNSQGLHPCSDPVSETSTTLENVLQSAMMWGPLVWRGLLVGLDSESSTNSALLVDPGEMIGLSLASAKASLQSLAVSCMKLMIPVLRDNKAITSALAQDVEADQVLGGMLSILHTSRRSHTGTDNLASTKSKASIGVSIQALKAWVLVVRLMGSAFVSHSKAGQKMLDLIKPQFHQLQPMAVKEEAFHAWVQLADSLSASGSVRKASRYSLLIQPFRHALMYDKEEGMCDVVMKAWCELVYAMRVPDKIQKQPAPTSQAIWAEGKCTGEGTELGNKGTTKQKSAEVEKSHEERLVDGRWRAMAIALTTCGPLGHSVVQLAEAARHNLPPEPAFIQGAVDDTAAQPPRSPVTHVSPHQDIGPIFRVKITVSKDVWCLVVMPVACVVLGLDNTIRPLPQTIQRRALSYLVPLLTKVCNPDNLKDLISLLQQAFSPAVSPHPASPNHSEDQTPHPVSLTPLSAISPLSALLSSESWQGSQAEHWSELLLYCYANLLDYLDSVFSPVSTNGNALLEGSATVNHQPLLSPLAAAEPLILSYMPLFTKILRCMSSTCIIPAYAPGESQSEDMIIPEAEQVKRSGALEDQACSWARVVKAVNQMCAITSAFMAAGLLSASASAAAAAAGRTTDEPPAPPQAFIYDLLNGISVTPPGQCTTATMHIDIALCDGRHPGGHLQTVMVMVHTNLKALLLKARPLGVLHVPVKGDLHLSASDSLTPHAVSRLSGTLHLPAMERAGHLVNSAAPTCYPEAGAGPLVNSAAPTCYPEAVAGPLVNSAAPTCYPEAGAGHLVNSAAPTCYPEAGAGPLMNDSSTSGRSCSAVNDDEPFRTSWQLLVIAWMDMLKGCRDLISSQEWMEGLSDLAQEAGKYCKDLSSFPLLLSTLHSSHFLNLVVAHGSANKDIAHASHEQDYHILKAWQCVNDSLVSCMASVISSSSIGSTKRAQSMSCVVEVLMFGAEWLVSVGSKKSKGRRASISSKRTEEGAESAMFKETDGIDEGVAAELPSEKGSIDYKVPATEASTLRSMAMDWSHCFKMLSEEIKKSREQRHGLVLGLPSYIMKILFKRDLASISLSGNALSAMALMVLSLCEWFSSLSHFVEDALPRTAPSSASVSSAVRCFSVAGCSSTPPHVKAGCSSTPPHVKANISGMATQLTPQPSEGAGAGVGAASPLLSLPHFSVSLDSRKPSYSKAAGVDLGKLSPGEISVRITDAIRETGKLVAVMLFKAMQDLQHGLERNAMTLQVTETSGIQTAHMCGCSGQALLDSLRAMLVLMGWGLLPQQMHASKPALPLVQGTELYSHVLLVVGDTGGLNNGWSSVFLFGFETLIPAVVKSFPSEVEEARRLSSGNKGKGCNKRKAAGSLSWGTHRLPFTKDMKPGATSIMALYQTSWDMILEGVLVLRARGYNVQDCVDALESPLIASVKCDFATCLESTCMFAEAVSEQDSSVFLKRLKPRYKGSATLGAHNVGPAVGIPTSLLLALSELTPSQQAHVQSGSPPSKVTAKTAMPLHLSSSTGMNPEQAPASSPDPCPQHVDPDVSPRTAQNNSSAVEDEGIPDPRNTENQGGSIAKTKSDPIKASQMRAAGDTILKTPPAAKRLASTASEDAFNLRKSRRFQASQTEYVRIPASAQKQAAGNTSSGRRKRAQGLMTYTTLDASQPAAESDIYMNGSMEEMQHVQAQAYPNALSKTASKVHESAPIPDVASVEWIEGNAADVLMPTVGNSSIENLRAQHGVEAIDSLQAEILKNREHGNSVQGNVTTACMPQTSLSGAEPMDVLDGGDALDADLHEELLHGDQPMQYLHGGHEGLWAEAHAPKPMAISLNKPGSGGSCEEEQLISDFICGEVREQITELGVRAPNAPPVEKGELEDIGGLGDCTELDVEDTQKVMGELRNSRGRAGKVILPLLLTTGLVPTPFFQHSSAQRGLQDSGSKGSPPHGAATHSAAAAAAASSAAAGSPAARRAVALTSSPAPTSALLRRAGRSPSGDCSDKTRNFLDQLQSLSKTPPLLFKDMEAKDINATQAALMELLTASHKAMCEKVGQVALSKPHT